MDKLLIVDGHNLLFQMFFGMPERIFNKEGKAIQGVLGFVGALLRIIKMTSPTKVVVLFDGEHKNDRKDLDGSYKSNRPDFSTVEEKDNPFSQLSDVYKCLDFLGIKHVEIEDYETDDAIASYVFEYGNDNEILISSFDSDFFQLITDKVKVLRYRGKNTIICDEEYVLSKFGVQPKFYADFKALVGDTSDNVKGVDKVGPKTAAYLLNAFGSIEGILKNRESVEKKSVRKALETCDERLLLNLKLIKLSQRAKIPFSLEALDYVDKNLSTFAVLEAVGVR